MLNFFRQLEPATQAAIWVMLIGALTNVACALVGCFLLLRRMSLMGDAISHAVLPGLVIAFVISGSLGIGPLFIGAILAGLATAVLTQAIHKLGRVSTDASMGVVFTTLFALGVILLKRYIEGVHFDVDCVWEGSLLSLVFDTVNLAGIEVPRQLFTIFSVASLNALVLVMFWKEFKIAAFDEGLATTLGFNAQVMHYLLMGLVAITAIASFEAVGSILVVAMLILPGATAHLLTDRLGRMVILACCMAIASSVLGYGLAIRWDVEGAGAMTIVAGAMFAVAVLLAPRYGILSRFVASMRVSLRVLSDDILGLLFRLEELQSNRSLSRRAAVTAVGGGILAHTAVARLLQTRRIARDQGELRLTATGRELARNLVRSHRLWEAFLVEYLDLPLDHVHEPAERAEHYISEDVQKSLAETVQNAGTDPHGRQIP